MTNELVISHESHRLLAMCVLFDLFIYLKTSYTRLETVKNKAKQSRDLFMNEFF